MLRAIYYPHTDIQNPIIIKNALLLWDSIETVVPRAHWQRLRKTGDREWRQGRRNSDRIFCEATELVVRHRVPSSAERQAAHESLSQLVASGAVSSLVSKSPEKWKRPDYLIYPEKFLHETWHLLEHEGMARWEKSENDYGVPAALGFLMMSTLANACAGNHTQRVTDRVDAYSWISQHLASTLGSPYVTGLDISQVAPTLDRLVTISCEVLDAREIPVKKLVEFRKRELKSGTTEYGAMRRRYSAFLQEHLNLIGKEAKTENDVRELEYEFKVKIRQDLADLRTELKVASWKTLFSKEVAFSTAILAGCLAAPIVGLTTLAAHLSGIGIIPLVRSGIEYRDARRKALRAHPISCLYLAKQGPLTAY